MNLPKHLILWLLLSLSIPASAYRIEISNLALAHTPVFLAGYYGNRVSVIDSVQTDATGKAVFERDADLLAGMYTLITPGKLSFDLLIDIEQHLRIEWLPTGDIRIEGDERAAVWAAYQTLENSRPDREQLAERRRQIIAQYPETFLAAYLAALHPADPPDTEAVFDMNQLMKTYQYRRRHFFDNMPLSDVRLLRTPLYYENIQYYVSQFVTQQTDTLIHVAYRMLEQASGNYETFYCVSDYLIDFSLRNKEIKNLQNLYNFVSRNRDMLGTKGLSMLPVRSGTNYFHLPDEKTLQNRLKNTTLTDIDGQAFHQMTLDSKFRIFYFWKNDCPRCIADISRWRDVLDRYRQKSYTGIAVNVKNDVQRQENRILAYDPLCINVSTVNMSWYETVFWVNFYSKIVVTDAEGNIIGIFASPASLDNFLRIVGFSD